MPSNVFELTLHTFHVHKQCHLGFEVHQPVPNHFINNVRWKTPVSRKQFYVLDKAVDRFIVSLCSVVKHKFAKITFDLGVTYARNSVHTVS